MIPKTIHYCWFGRNPKPKLAKKCIRSWKKHCPDYQIIEWNEDNFDISACPLYVRQAYEAKKWAFVTDYVRLKVVYDHGGIYLDTDVELRKKPDSLLGNDAYFGFEDGKYIATGLGFGAIKGHPVLLEMMEDYEGISFIKEDGSYDTLPCPLRNTHVLLCRGLQQEDKLQTLEDNILILPSAVLNPVSFFDKKKRIDKDTISIHWYAASWYTKKDWEQKKKRKREVHKRQMEVYLDWLIHIPNWAIRFVLGTERYEDFKKRLKKER